MKKLNILLILILLLHADSDAQIQKGTNLIGISGSIGQSINLSDSKQSGFYFYPSLKYGYFLSNRISVGANISLSYYSSNSIYLGTGAYMSIFFPIKDDAFFIETAYQHGYESQRNDRLSLARAENSIQLGPGYLIKLSQASLIQINLPITYSWYNVNSKVMTIYRDNYNWSTGFNIGLKVGFYFLILPKNEKK